MFEKHKLRDPIPKRKRSIEERQMSLKQREIFITQPQSGVIANQSAKMEEREWKMIDHRLSLRAEQESEYSCNFNLNPSESLNRQTSMFI